MIDGKPIKLDHSKNFNKNIDLVSKIGFKKTEVKKEASCLVLNTCHIREKATEKIYSELGRIKKSLASKEKKTTIAVAGCVAQAEGKELVKRNISSEQAVDELIQLIKENDDWVDPKN